MDKKLWRSLLRDGRPDFCQWKPIIAKSQLSLKLSEQYNLHNLTTTKFIFIFHLFIRHKGYKREKKMKKKKRSYCLQSYGEEAQKKPAGL